jgi:hypothetical protein
MAVRVLLVSAGVLFVGCRESARDADKGDSGFVDPAPQGSTSSPAPAPGNEEASTEIQPSTEEEIAELRREIDSGKQGIEDIEAFVQMERAKLDEDPEYDRSFMLDALDEQEQLKEAIETGEARLEELTGPQP